jgi:hypothetical protein
MRENGLQSMRLQKTDTETVWMLTVPSRTPYPSIDAIADTALLRYRPTVIAPVSQFRTDQTSWAFNVSRRARSPLPEAVKSISTHAETGYRLLKKTMEAIETARDHLLPIIPVLLHPELIFVTEKDSQTEHADVQIVTLPLSNIEHSKGECKPELIEWMGEVFHWDASVTAQLAELFSKEAFFDLLLEAKALCGEPYNPPSDTDHKKMSPRKAEHSHAQATDFHEQAVLDHELKSSKNESSGERLVSKLKKLGETLFGYRHHEMIHEVTQELDLSSDQFKIAQLSEGLPGTPEEELGHHAYILTDEFAIGRDMGKSDFWIDSSSISRQHAVIRRRAGSYFIEDRGSRNGTTVDGIKLSKHREQLLPDKCKISFADHVYHFRST